MKQLTSQKVVFVALLVVSWMSTVVAQQQCATPEYKTYASKQEYVELRKTGEFCLSKDLYAKRQVMWTEGRDQSTGRSTIRIGAKGAVLDLQNKTVNRQLEGEYALVSIWSAEPQSKIFIDHVILRNGTLINRTAGGIVSDLWAYEADWPLLHRYVGHAEDERAKKFPPDAMQIAIEASLAKVDDKSRNKEKRSILAYNKITWTMNRNDLSNFPATKHQFENLKIEATGFEKDSPDWKQDLNASHGIVIKGAGNIIRNCTIEVTNTDAGIYLFGPGQIIENNTIIFKGHLPQGMSAPIRLSLADGSIIRNNTIIVKNGGKDQPVAAISLIDSRGVVIENNTIKGVDSLYKVWDEVPEQKTAVIEKNNRIKAWWQVF